jgi:hypothetical protein
MKPRPRKLQHHWEPIEPILKVGSLIFQPFKSLCDSTLHMQLPFSKKKMHFNKLVDGVHKQHTVNPVAAGTNTLLSQHPLPCQTVHSGGFPSRLTLTSGRNEARRGSSSIETPKRPQLTLQI